MNYKHLSSTYDSLLFQAIVWEYLHYNLESNQNRLGIIAKS